ncbi:hypothetical protein GE09DRAFT_253670 [Coniochaeta sp. 2T2.1]|nr:hypothetical protein GE09DRAFT_253670 [Coniochaeta sp. 2T2.1]
MTGTAAPSASTVGERSILSECTDGQSLQGEIEQLLRNWKDYQAGVETGRKVSSPENEPADGAMEQLSLVLDKADGDFHVVQVQEAKAGPELAKPPYESPRQLIRELTELAHVYRQALRHKDAQKLLELAVVEAVEALGAWDVDPLRIFLARRLLLLHTGTNSKQSSVSWQLATWTLTMSPTGTSGLPTPRSQLSRATKTRRWCASS